MYSKRVDEEDLNSLVDAILSLETADECKAFLEDLCTIAEINSMSQRWSVARILRSGGTYTEAIEKTGASSTTVSRIKKCLDYGAGGYMTVLERMEKKGK